MQELIKIGQRRIGENEINAVDARELHGLLEVGKDFSSWFKERVEKYNFEENQDFIRFSPETGKTSGGRPSIEYFISIDMAKELAMVEKTEIGKQARRYFIECEKALKSIVAPKSEAEKLLEAFSILTNQVETEKALRLEAERTKAMIGDKKVATAMATASVASRKVKELSKKNHALEEESQNLRKESEAAKLEAEKAKEAEKKYKRRALKFATLSDDLEEEVDKLKAKLEEVTIKEETFKAVTAIPWLKNYFLTLNNLTLQQIGKRLSSISRESGLETGEVQHEKYGVAKTYHPKAISKFKALMDADRNLLGNYRK